LPFFASETLVVGRLGIAAAPDSKRNERHDPREGLPVYRVTHAVEGAGPPLFLAVLQDPI
jgi:hypothetical protein